MMKLYYAPGACSISPHIALREAELQFSLEKVDFAAGKKLADGRSLPDVSPKGSVPALILDNGDLLTEGAVIVQYIADQRPEKQLAPKNGTFERVRLQEWLNFIATDLHKGLSPFFSSLPSPEYKAFAKERLTAKLGIVAAAVASKPWLMGDHFTVADGYAFYILRSWQNVVKEELHGSLKAYWERLSARPAIVATLAAESA
jgi:glutathione S-transferase